MSKKRARDEARLPMLNQEVANALVSSGLRIDSIVAIVLNYLEYGHSLVKSYLHNDAKFNEMFEIDDGRIVMQSGTNVWCIFDFDSLECSGYATNFYVENLTVCGKFIVVFRHHKLEFFDTTQKRSEPPVPVSSDVFAFASGGGQLLSIHEDGTVIQWDLTNFRISRARKALELSRRDVLFLDDSFVISPNGKFAALITTKSSLVILDLETFAMRPLEPPKSICALVFVTDTLLAAGWDDETLRIVDFDTGLFTTLDNKFKVETLCTLPCGTLVAIGKNEANLWNPYTGKLLANYKLESWMSFLALRNGRLLFKTAPHFYMYE